MPLPHGVGFTTTMPTLLPTMAGRMYTCRTLSSRLRVTAYALPLLRYLPGRFPGLPRCYQTRQHLPDGRSAPPPLFPTTTILPLRACRSCGEYSPYRCLTFLPATCRQRRWPGAVSGHNLYAGCRPAGACGRCSVLFFSRPVELQHLPTPAARPLLPSSPAQWWCSATFSSRDDGTLASLLHTMPWKAENGRGRRCRGGRGDC